MKVRAKKRGFFAGVYRKPGAFFDCPKDAFSVNWMELVTDDIKPLKDEKYIPLEIPHLMEKADKPKLKKKKAPKQPDA